MTFARGISATRAQRRGLDLLLRDANERDQLSRDLLINVTGFFRDAAVFDFLAKSVIPDLVRDHPPEIYLLPEAQAKVISIIHFALRDGGLLLVGDAETVGVADGRFAVVSKPQRIYRRVRGARPGDFGLSSGAGDGSRLRARPGQAPIPPRQINLAELCRRMGACQEFRVRAGRISSQAAIAFEKRSANMTAI